MRSFWVFWLAAGLALGLLAVATALPSAEDAVAITPIEWSVTLQASGAGPYHWGVMPETAALEPIKGGQSVLLTTSRPGRYAVTAFDGTAATVYVVALGGDGAPSPIPGPDLPDTGLATFVRELTADVEAADHGDVGAAFLALADRIKADELQGSTAISAATADSLFGPADADGNRPRRQAWKAWYNSLTAHLFGELKLVTPGQWEAAYREIGKAVKP